MHCIILTPTKNTLTNSINLQTDILQNGTMHILYHVIGRPLEKMLDGNHFAYLEPIMTPTFSIGINTIQQISESVTCQNNGNFWTKKYMIELYTC